MHQPGGIRGQGLFQECSRASGRDTEEQDKAAGILGGHRGGHQGLQCKEQVLLIEAPARSGEGRAKKKQQVLAAGNLKCL